MDIKKIDLRLEQGNRFLEVGKGRPFRLLKIEGISAPNYNITSSTNINGYGSRINKKDIPNRDIILEFEYVGKEKKEARKRLTSFFNLGDTGKLIIDVGTGVREIFYEVESFNAPLENINYPLKCLVSLYCSDPFFTDEEKNIEIVNWIGGLTFPLELPTEFATAGEKEINIINSGDMETPVVIEILGSVTKPKILNRTTGEYIRINKTFTVQDKLIITTAFGNKRVEQNGISVFNFIDLSSDFFSLRKGDNVIEFSTEDINDDASIQIKYKNRYLGV